MVECPHASFGCSWRGARGAETLHLSECAQRFVALQFGRLEGKIEKLAVENESLRTAVRHLKSNNGLLSETLSDMRELVTILSERYIALSDRFADTTIFSDFEEIRQMLTKWAVVDPQEMLYLLSLTSSLAPSVVELEELYLKLQLRVEQVDAMMMARAGTHRVRYERV